MEDIIYLYHTNDVHSHFENWPRIADYLRQARENHRANNEEVFLFDIGDFVDRWHPFTEGTLGKGNVELLNEAGYTAAAIGNNEGITLPHNALDTLYNEAKFDVICANLYYPGKVRPSWVKPYRLYETAAGTKIAVTSVTAYYQKLYGLLGWELTEPVTELAMTLNELKGKADITIVLSHLGIHEDERLAEDFPEIDLILGAHTHHLLPEGKMVNNTLLAAAGRYGEYAGIVKLRFDGNRSKLTGRAAQVVKTSSLEEPAGAGKFIERLQEDGKKQLGKEVARLSEPLSFSWTGPSSLADLLCASLHDWCGGDCTMINSGLILKGLDKGPVTKYDIHQMLPHPINPCTVEVTGAELKEILRHALQGHWADLPLKGLGFRGKVMGNFTFHCIEFNPESKEVKVAGKRLVPTQTYRLSIPDLFTFGPFFPEIQRAKEKTYFMPEFLRDIFQRELESLYPIPAVNDK